MPDLSNNGNNMHQSSNSYTQRNKSFDELHNNDSANNSPFSPTGQNRPEILTIPIVKGAMGFGFTIADSAYGQKVKQILDKARCRNLIEGDILVDINNIRVKDMPHSDVVKVLKECLKGHTSTIIVQRGGKANSIPVDFI